MNKDPLQDIHARIAEAIIHINNNRTLAYQDLKEGDGYEALEYLENMSVWIKEAHELVSAQLLDAQRADKDRLPLTDQERTEDASSSFSYTPYDAGYLRVQKKQLDLPAYVIQKERLDQDGYLLGLGAFVQFALEAFPILYPNYRIPDPLDMHGKHLLELFLHAYYGKNFKVLATDFWVEDDSMRRAMPDWAIRWMQLWRKLPPGTLIGKEEVLGLLDWLWNTSWDARGVLTTAMDNWLYGMIYGRERP